MNPRVVIFDTNFFLGTRSTFRSDAEMRDFLLDLETSFKENGIRPVIPARVLGEIDGFSGALARFLEYTFEINAPVNTEENGFFLNIKWINRARSKKKRWFHVGEVTDIEILAVAKQIIDDTARLGRSTVNDGETWIVTDDEGIQKATGYFFGDEVRALEAATFLSYLLGVSNNPEIQDKLEHVSKRIFHYFTTFRRQSGRRPVSQLDTFFSEMLNHIRMARKDIQASFDPPVQEHFERFLLLGDELPMDLSIYKPLLLTIAKIFEEISRGDVRSMDTQLSRLYCQLGNLAKIIPEIADYRRFYNYIAVHLLKVHLEAFKIAFQDFNINHSQHHLIAAKGVIQGLLDQEPISQMHPVVLLVETIFNLLLVGVHQGEVTSSGYEAHININVECLVSIVNAGTLPSILPDHLVFLAIMTHFLGFGNGKVVSIEGLNKPEMHVNTELALPKNPRKLMPSLYILEDFIDEVTSYGNHALALNVYKGLHGLFPPNRTDDIERIEGKIYLTCLIMNRKPENCFEGRFDGSWEKTSEELDDSLITDDFTAISAMNQVFHKRVKILSHFGIIDSHHGYIAWIYPLRSKFLVKIPLELIKIQPGRMKDFKITRGKIKVRPFKPADAPERDNSMTLRGTITLDAGCEIEIFTYQQDFFTLDLV